MSTKKNESNPGKQSDKELSEEALKKIVGGAATDGGDKATTSIRTDGGDKATISNNLGISDKGDKSRLGGQIGYGG